MNGSLSLPDRDACSFSKPAATGALAEPDGSDRKVIVTDAGSPTASR